MGRRQDGGRRRRGREEEGDGLDERVVHIARTAKVVKGGRRFNFRALVVVGDNKGSVGIGVGKARQVPDAIRKAAERARKNMKQVPLAGTTIPHEITVRYSAARVMLRPASPGTGVIAGGSVRAVIEAAGYRDILAKSLGSNNVLNVIQATMNGLHNLRSVREVASERDKDVAAVAPFWTRQ